MSKILLADDEATFRETLAAVLAEEGMDVTAVANGKDAIEAVNAALFDVAILDIKMPGADGIKVLREIRNRRPDTRVILITAFGSVEMAVEAIKLGACDYVVKPVILDDILVKIRQQLQFKELSAENRQLKNTLQGQFGIENIIGKSAVMQPVFDTILKLAQIKSNVLIVGESGTGKELVARAIHAEGPTKKERFIGINCGAIPEGLLESELFGHKKGSFTSAVEDKKGLFELANGGTLFLDEIGHMPLNCQVKLLRAIEERQAVPVGGTEPVRFNLRLVAATNKNPLDEIKVGRFREDLYYRLNVVGIYLPPLRERKEDIGLLVEHFIRKYNAQMGKNCRGITNEAMDILMSSSWKGNIRELQNVIERAVIFAEGDMITSADIGPIGPGVTAKAAETENLQEILRQREREHLYRILRKYGQNKAAAAKALGVGLSSLYRKMDELGISPEEQNRKRQSEPGATEEQAAS